MERTHTEISQLREMIDFCRARGRAPPDHFYRDLDILHSKYDQLSLALAESHQAFASSRRGHSPVVASPSVASPSAAPRPPRPDSSPLEGLRLSPQPGPSSFGDHRFALQDRRRPRDASSDLSRRSCFSEERFRERFATSDKPNDSRRFASIPAPVRAMIDFILKSFPDAQASPSHPSSRSFDLSAYAGVTDAAIPPGSLLAWCHALSDAFSDTQQRFARRIKDGKVCHTLLRTLNRFERVSNSPTQGKELKPNPDVLDLLRNRVPDNRHVPLSLKEAAALERSLRSGLESHNFLT